MHDAGTPLTTRLVPLA